jgi:hypothetical protein
MNFVDFWEMGKSHKLGRSIFTRMGEAISGKDCSSDAILWTGMPAYRFAHAGYASLSRHHRNPRRGTRPRLLADDDLDVLVERGQERHQPLDREAADTFGWLMPSFSAAAA